MLSPGLAGTCQGYQNSYSWNWDKYGNKSLDGEATFARLHMKYPHDYRNKVITLCLAFVLFNPLTTWCHFAPSSFCEVCRGLINNIQVKFGYYLTEQTNVWSIFSCQTQKVKLDNSLVFVWKLERVATLVITNFEVRLAHRLATKGQIYSEIGAHKHYSSISSTLFSTIWIMHENNGL